MRRRRDFIKYLGAATVGLSGCVDSDSIGRVDRTPTAPARTDIQRTETPVRPPPPELESNYDTVHDVTEAGLDPTGQTRIDDQLHELAANDTLLFFPAGTYLTGQLSFKGLSNFGLYGDGATLKLATSGRHIFMNFRRVADIHVEGFSIDNSASNTAAWCDVKCIGGTNTIKNYRVEEFVDVDERTNGFTLMVQGEDTSLELDSVDLRKGGLNAAAVFVFPRRDFYDPDRHGGSLTFRDCVMNGWGKEGLYASANNGPIRVLGGEYANNAIAQVRVGGGEAANRAVVRGVTVRITEIPDYMPEGNRNLRGIWLKEGDGALVEDCTVEVSNLGPSQTQGGIIVNHQFGRATIRNCRLRSDVQRPAIVIDEPAEEYEPAVMPSISSLPPEWDVLCENVTIEGQSPNIEAISVAGRNGCEFRNVEIDTDGQVSDGIRFDRVPSCRIDGSTISVDRFPLVFELVDETGSCAYRLGNSTIEGMGLTHTGSELATADDGVFCLDESVEPNPPSDERTFAFTLLESLEGDSPDTADPSSGEGSDQTGEGSVLYGRWVDGS